jgi:hypothetical protein
MRKYRYEMQGTGIGGNGHGTQQWQTEGVIQLERQGDFPRMLDQAQLSSFKKLTNGEAVYGQPGVGCQGPYQIKRMLVEEIEP